MMMGALMWLGLAVQPAANPPKPHKLTLEQAVQQVQRDTGGRVLSADSVRSGRSSKYRIKVLTEDGRVRVVEVDSDPNKGAKADSGKGRSKETH
jgi:hypothetical protein